MIELPERPQLLHDQLVAAWSEPVTIPTYPVPSADRSPMFLESVYTRGRQAACTRIR